MQVLLRFGLCCGKFNTLLTNKTIINFVEAEKISIFLSEPILYKTIIIIAEFHPSARSAETFDFSQWIFITFCRVSCIFFAKDAHKDWIFVVL